MRVVVIGGDAGGATAAATAKRLDPALDVVMFERGAWTSYSACCFPYAVADVVTPFERLLVRSAAEHQRRGIDARIHTEVTAIDLAARTVTWRNLESGAEGREPYDRLVYATGAEPARPPGIAGLDLGHFLWTPAQARTLHAALAGADARHAVIVGGG